MRRPAAYAPLSVTFATGKTGTVLQDKYGLEGLGTWAAIIATGKKGRGQIVFAHEEDWLAIGVLHKPAKFTLTAFLKTTGQLKQTRTTRQGHVLYVQLTHYEDWNNDAQRQDDRERKSRYDHETNRNKSGRMAEHNRNKMSAELEAELDIEKSSNEETLLKPAGDGFEPKGLPFSNELLYLKLMELIGTHGDDNTPAVVRSYAKRASEGQLAKVLESASHAHARNRASYVVGALKAELEVAA